jgi:hypothetical protein
MSVDYTALVDELPDEVVDLIAEQQDQIEDLQKRLAEVEVEAPAPAADEPTSFEKALETLPAEVAKAIQDDRERLAKAEAELAAEKIAKADAEWTTRATQFSALSIDPATFGPAMRQVHEALPEVAETISKALTGAAEVVALTNIFKEIGHNATPGSVEDQITQFAKAKLAENPDLGTIEVARAEVYEEHPDLYTALQAERQR